ncbi:hypothetical protein ACLM5J_05510 [Nocardioides sp. Bht2]|uniref:hypothetical protein n=1 Tax=Nocardioides sp. Bht2 TaxID=3392297 RepID=UPI0039B68557
MKFSENEMTVAVDAAARHLFLARQMPWRRRGALDRWEKMAPFAKYQLRATAGEMVLPTLTALPERPVESGRPAFTAAEVTEAAEGGARGLLNHRDPEAWEKLGARRRKAMLHLTSMVTRLALAAMPERTAPPAASGDQEPPTVPDTPEGLM